MCTGQLLRRGLLALLLIAGPVGAATLEGQQFPDRITLGESELQLNGLGLRAVAIIRAYVVGIYLSERANTEQAVVAAPGPKRIEIRMLRAASAKDFNRAMIGGIRNNAAPEEWNRLQERIKQMEDSINAIGTVREGDRITLDFDPMRGMLLGLNGQLRAEPIAGFDFFAALLRIFVGAKPVDERLKKALLG